MSNKREKIRPEKKQKVKALAEILKSAKSAIFVDYVGMDVKSQQDLKRRLKEAGARMLVAKNTLLKIAGKEAKLPEESLSEQVLQGQTAMVTSDDDPVSPIQSLGKFLDEFEMPQFKAGVVEGVFQDKEGLTRISKLPSKEELYAQVVGAVAGPMYALAGTLQGNMQKLLFILEQAKEKTEGGEVHG